MQISRRTNAAQGLVGIPVDLMLFVFLFSIYSFTMAGSIQYGDEIEKYRVAQSIVDRRDLSFRPTQQRSETGAGGRNYSIYELGQTLLEIPFYVAGRLIDSFHPLPDINQTAQLIVGFLNPLLTALTAVLLYRTCLVLGFADNLSLALALVFGLATIVWPYSKGFTREPLLTFLLLLSFYLLYHFQQTGDAGWLVAAGTAAGYLVFTKFIHGVVLPVLMVYLVIGIWQQPPSEERRQKLIPVLRALFFFMLPAIVFLGLQSLYAYARFGTLSGGIAGTKNNPIDWILLLLTQGRPDQAMIGLLFSPEKSVFLYSPPVLLGLIGWFKWLKLQTREALVFLALILVEWATVIGRPDWDGGTWWGPRYLVQITPFLIVPLGALASSQSRPLWRSLLAVLASAGVIVQIVGVSGSSRDYLDATGRGITLGGQLQFLFHGAIDSLWLYLSPGALFLWLNPYGVLLIGLALLCGIALVLRIRAGEPGKISPRFGLAALMAVWFIQTVALIAWVTQSYPQVQAARGDTKLAAGNSFLADGDRSKARAMYALALDLGTQYRDEAAARLEELTGRTHGDTLSAYDLMRQVQAPENAVLTADRSVVLKGETSLKLAVPGGQEATVSTMSDWIPALPGATFELSGWLKTENIYGSGYGVVGVYEDNGVWQNPRKADVVTMDETGGWRLFRKRITTQPTTRRILVSVGLWNTYGTLWLDDLELARVSNP